MDLGISMHGMWFVDDREMERALRVFWEGYLANESPVHVRVGAVDGQI